MVGTVKVVVNIEGILKRLPVTGGAPETVTEATNAGADWNRDDLIVFTRADGGLSLIPAVGGSPRDIATPDTAAGERLYWDPKFLPDGRSILFVVHTDQERHIAALSLDGTDRRILVEGSAPRLARSGHLLFVRDRSVWAVPFDDKNLDISGEPVRVLEGIQVNGAGFARYEISPDGTLVYVPGPVGEPGTLPELPQYAMVSVDWEGNTTPTGAPRRFYRHPRVSPDGTQVAVQITETLQSERRWSIWVYDLSGDAAIRRLTQLSDGNNVRPVWTPDGERITFASDREGPTAIYWQPADGSGPAEPLTTPTDGEFHVPDSWSPDGVLAFEVRRRPRQGMYRVAGDIASGELWTRDADGELAPFYNLPDLTQFGAAFFPNGRWLAYSSAEAPEDPVRLFVGAYPGNVPRYEVVANGAAWPVWSANGDTLVFRLGTGVGSDSSLRRVEVETDPTFRFTTEQSTLIDNFVAINDFRDYDPLPDGSGLIVLTLPEPTGNDASMADDSDDTADAGLVVVLNFFEELNARVPLP